MPRTALALLACAGLVAVTACGSSDPAPAAKAAGPTGSTAVTGRVDVFAAASLTGVFGKLATTFEAAHPGTKVVLNLGPSSGLATSIGQGAPADVFASASQLVMDKVVKAGDATGPTVFARNALQIATPPSDPGHVGALADLGRKGVKVALCQAQVPCGALAAKVLTKAGVRVVPVTEEVDVKAVLTKVTLGEVDAGLVYVTDIKAAGTKVRGVAVPGGPEATTAYPIAPLVEARNAAGARAFVDLVLSPQGTAELTAAGFERP